MTVTVEIDGQKLTVKAGSSIIEAADHAGIRIPRFCYHKKLSVAANCRMCLVEVEKARKPMPACATPVTDGMKVFTRSPTALKAQRSVMEFLLINHPLDCPVCDQGGQCELQDNAMAYGRDISRYNEGKRVVAEKNLGPLISTSMTRCIHCTRCVRFGEEIAGIQEMGSVGRGENTEIMPYIEQTIDSELSGNMIDVCPVGALNSKPFLFKARAWELTAYPTVSFHDCLGSNMLAHVYRQEKVMQCVPRANEHINETWLSDRDRFSYEGLYAEDRISSPMIKRDNKWHTITWQEAFKEAAKMIAATFGQYGVEQLGAVASPSSTIEEFFLLQELLRAMGSDNIDFRVKQGDFSDDGETVLTASEWQLDQLVEKDVIVVVGANIAQDQPILGHRLRQAALAGAKVIVINSMDYPINFPVAESVLVAPHEMIPFCVQLLKALGEQQVTAHAGFQDIQPTDQAKACASLLSQAKNSAVIVGLQAHSHPSGAWIRRLSKAMARHCHSAFGQMSEGANSLGGFLAGAVPFMRPDELQPQTHGLNLEQMFEQQLKLYLLLNVEPEMDCLRAYQAKNALANAQVISLSPYLSAAMRDYADLVLPITPITENEGTFINFAGLWQTFAAVHSPVGEARPAWKVLKMLGDSLNLPGFAYQHCHEILSMFKELHKEHAANTPMHTEISFNELDCPSNDQLQLICETPLYRVDNLVRRAKSLNQTLANPSFHAMMHPQTAKHHGLNENDPVSLSQGEHGIELTVALDAKIPVGYVLWLGGHQESSVLADPFGSVTLDRQGGKQWHN